MARYTLQEFIQAKHASLLDLIEDKGELNNEVVEAIQKCLKDFRDIFTPTQQD